LAVEEEAEEVTDVSSSLILGSLVFSANEANPDYFPKNQVMFQIPVDGKKSDSCLWEGVWGESAGRGIQEQTLKNLICSP